MCNWLIPLVSINEMIDSDGHLRKILCQAANAVYNHIDIYKTAFPDSIQCNKLRTKVHCNQFYHTTKAKYSKLRDCSLKFKILFPKKREQQAILNFCKDLHTICSSIGIENVEWLLADPHKKIPFMFAIYHGYGINSHIDLNFEGPVFVLTILIKQTKKNANPSDCKCISLGMEGINIMSIFATLINEECQLYFFYGYLTDYAYHGVPRTPGWTSIVFIIRKGRVNQVYRG